MLPKVDITSQKVTSLSPDVCLVTVAGCVSYVIESWFSKCAWDLAEWLERLTANTKIATVLGSIPASSDTVESEERQMKQCWNQYKEEQKIKKIALLEGK